MERLPQSQHVGRDQQSRLLADKTKQSKQSRRNPEQLAQVFLDLDSKWSDAGVQHRRRMGMSIRMERGKNVDQKNQ